MKVPSKEVARMLLEMNDGLVDQEEISELLKSMALKKEGDRRKASGSAAEHSAAGEAGRPSSDSRSQPPVASEARSEASAKSKATEKTATASGEDGRRSHVERHDDDAKLEIQRAEPGASPLESAKSWADLNLSPELLKGVESLGFRKPSKIQAAALPLVLNHRENLIAQAQNGSGKTATFALSMLSCVDEALPMPQALCICPTRELAQQTVVVLKDLSRFTQVDIFLAVPQTRVGASALEAAGDELDDKFYRNAQGRVVVFTTNTAGDVCQQIVVGTPGKSADLLKKRVFKPKAVKMFVLDEADELINYSNNMAPQVQQIRRFLNPDLQILLFSATYSDSVRAFAEKLIPRANKITLKREELTLTCIRQFYMMADPAQPLPEGSAPTPEDEELLQTLDPSVLSVFGNRGSSRGGVRGCRMSRDELLRVFQHKYNYLKVLYSALAVGQSVIFVNSRRLAFFLALKMQNELNFSVSLICGSQAQGPEKLSIEIRDKIMREFRQGETKVLICTDVLARGIDVPQVTLVVNFDLPIYFNKGLAGPEAHGGGVTGAETHGCWDSAAASEGAGPNAALQAIAGDGPCVNFETYLHRIGRTGRFGLKGIAVNLVSPQDAFLLDQIKAFYGCSIEPLEPDPEEIEAIIKSLRVQQQ